MVYLKTKQNVSIIDRATLWVVFGLLLFNYGFQMIRVPPSGIGLPLAEIMLAFVLLKANVAVMFRKLRTIFNVEVFVIYFIYFSIRVFFGYLDNGISAVRDGLPVFESMYIFVGFHLARNAQTNNIIKKYMVYTSILICLYILLYPFANDLKSFIPHLTSYQGIPVPIFFNYTNTTLVALMAAAWSIEQYYSDGYRRRYIIFSVMLILAILIFLPSRTLFLMIIVFGLLIGIRGSMNSLLKVIPFIFTGVVFFILVIKSDINIQGKFGDSLSIDSYVQLFTEILFDSEEGNISSGIGGRIVWWESVIHRTTDSLVGLLFGLGYGVPLIDFRGFQGVVVSEPHNTLVSVFGRAGLIGLGLFILVQVQILKIVYFAFKRASDSTIHKNNMILPITMLLLGTLTNSLGESPFVMPFYAVPYYFFAGCLMRYNYNTNNSRVDRGS